MMKWTAEHVARLGNLWKQYQSVAKVRDEFNKDRQLGSWLSYSAVGSALYRFGFKKGQM